MDTQQEQQLTQGGECYLHYHPEDRTPTHDTLNRLQNLASCVEVTTDYAMTYENDHVMGDGTLTVTLPLARAGKEFEVTNVGTGTVTVVPTTPDTIQGTTSVVMAIQWTSLRFKSITAGWVLI